jgi:hypothetical protein
MLRARLSLTGFGGEAVKFLYRSSQAGQTGKSGGKLTQLGAVAGLMVLGRAALDITAPVSLLLLRLSPDVCRACVTILRLCGE